MMIRFTLLLSLLFVTSSSFAALDLAGAFEALKTKAVNWDPDGAVCEQLTRVKARDQYPENAYDIIGDVEYDIGALTVGELDLLVIEKNSGKVILVEEVKCWKSFQGGIDKARSQKLRFEWHLSKYPQQIRFTSDEMKISAANFSSSFPFIFVSQAGGAKWGFDQELDLNLSDIKKLRMMLLKCQDSHQCPKAP